MAMSSGGGHDADGGGYYADDGRSTARSGQVCWMKEPIVHVLVRLRAHGE